MTTPYSQYYPSFLSITRYNSHYNFSQLNGLNQSSYTLHNSTMTDMPRIRSKHLRQHVKDSCEKLNVSLPITDYMLAHMHFDHARKLVYCFVPKVACTSWKRVWLKLTNIVPQNKTLLDIDRYFVHTSLPNLASQKSKLPEILETYRKFMFVRHPFDRVLSAYKDKFENEDKKSSYNFHKEIGKKIEAKYRKPSTDGKNVTFEDFMHYISEPEGNSFEQLNEHWRSLHQLCNPCSINYDFIGKYENIHEDAPYVLDWIGASDLIGRFPSSDRPFNAKRYDPHYFNQLSSKTKLLFFAKFIADFIPFDYDIL
ncbi:unnamed protein product, partial [Meganyctiphanes norvegica]